MRIYVAGSTNQITRVRGIQDEVIGLGHRITYDWTNYVKQHGDAHKDKVPDDIQRDGAAQDLSGVQGAQALIAYVTPECIGTLVEIGMAIHKNIPVLVFRGHGSRGSVFYKLDGVTELPYMMSKLPADVKNWIGSVNS